MQLIVTKHLRDRLAERGITEADVRNALRHFHISYETPKPSWCFEGPALNGRTIKVWCPPGKAGPETYIVKSTAWKE